MTIDRTRSRRQQQQRPAEKEKRAAIPQSTSTVRLQETSSRKMDWAERTAKKEAILKLPDTQTREIFSVALSERAKIPFIKLPEAEKPQSSQTTTRNASPRRHHNNPDNNDNGSDGHVEDEDEEDESDDTDVEDVEELFLELAQELDSEDKVTQHTRLARVAKEQHGQTAPPSTIALPQSVFTFPSNDYFSPGAPFLASTGSPMTPQPEKRRRTSAIGTPTPEPDPPTINVRIAGGDIIQDVFLSPIVERPPSTPTTQQQQHHHHRASWLEQHESYQTRSDEEQLMHGVHPFSLRPPPHLMRSRRQSRTAQQNGAVTLEGVRAAANQQEQQPSLSSDIPETRSQASSKNSGTSAVSPRFMALRKLSESGFMSSYAKPPPPPPPPPTATHSSSENSSIAPDTTDLNYALHEQRLLDRIDEMIETKLKSNISEILWRATESHRDARRFWEDQRRDMLELGASILHKLSMNQEQQRQQQQAVRPQRRRQRQRRYHPDGTIMSPEDQEEEEEDDDDDLIFEEEELESLRKLRIDLENEVSGYQLKEIAQQTELQSIRQRNAELEKQVEMHRQRNSELETRLAATATTTTSSVVTQDRPCAPTIEKSVTAAGAGESSTTTTTPDLSATTSVVSRDVQTDNNRIISTATMDWADVVAEDEWAKKYTELESKYQVANSKIAELKKQLRRQSSSTTATAAALVKQPRPASSMATVRPPSRTTTASPLPAATTATATATANNNNYSSKHRKHKSMTVVAPPSNNTKERKASHRQSYFMNEDGHLTFTTEINGRLSQYTVKLPGKEDTSSSASSKLNPLAQPWKTPTTH